MKTTLISTILLLTGVSIVSAQNSMAVGVRADWDYSVPATNINGIGSGSGVSAGVFCDIPVVNNLFFEPGVSFFYDTADLDYFDLFLNGKELGPSGQLRNMGFRAPIFLGYRFDLVEDISLSVITGPQVNYGLSNKVHYDQKAFKDLNLYNAGWQRWDIGWTFGVKLHYQDNFFAEITGTVGISNQLDKDYYHSSHFRRNMVNVGVGYSF